MAVFDQVRQLVIETMSVPEDEPITPETSFESDLGADSLAMVELVMALEEEFGIDIPDEDAESIKTVGEAVRHIEAKTGA